MDRSEYWKIVESGFEFNHDSQFNKLKALLNELPKEQLEWFLSHQRQIIIALYDANVWCFCNVVFGDCGDSRFQSFREWASMQNESFVSSLLANPDEVAETLT